MFSRGIPLALLASSCACRSVHRGDVPWSELAAGVLEVSLRPAAFTAYDVEGAFTSLDFATGETLSESDAGAFEGRFGAALGLGVFLGPSDLLELGADFRRYDIEGLSPIEELDVAIDRSDSWQAFALWRHLFAATDSMPRLRPFGELSLAYLPGVDVGLEVDLSSFGSSNLRIESEGEATWVGGLAAGAVYDLGGGWLAELGLRYEAPLADLEVDLGFEIAGSTVPLAAELEPAGWIGWVGLSRVFGAR